VPVQGHHDGHVFVAAREPGGLAMCFRLRVGPRRFLTSKAMISGTPWPSTSTWVLVVRPRGPVDRTIGRSLTAVRRL
jgi:hypothetical protein